MDKATYADLERTFTYYDLEVIQEATNKLIEEIITEIDELIKKKESAEKTMKRVSNKLKEVI